MLQVLKQHISQYGVESLGRFYGVYVGIVKDIGDTRHANRILVNVPEVYGDTDFVRIALPNFGIMGPDYGLHFLPKVGGVVSITFKQGDPDFPYWTPGPYHNEKAPKEFVGHEIIGFKSRTGHIVSIDDNEDNNSITIQHKDGYYIEIKEDKITVGNDVRIEIHDKGIDIGKKNDGLQPAVLGDALKQWLQDLVIEITKLQTVDAKNMNPANITTLTEHAATLPEILAKFPS